MALPISLQVLVENAHKHNEFSVREPLEVRISLEGERLVVRNRLAPKEVFRGAGARGGRSLGRAAPDAGSPGLGLSNLGERYRVAVGVAVGVEEARGEFAVYLPILPVE